MADDSSGLTATISKAVTFTIVIAIAGIFFLALALAGTLSFRGTSLAVTTVSLRVASSVFGSALLAAAVLLEAKDRAGKREKAESPTGSPLPATVDLLHTLDAKSAESFPQMVADAVRVSIVSRTAVNLLGHYERTFRDLGRRGCEIRLLLVDPSCVAAQSLYGDNPTLYNQNAAITSTHAKKLKSVLGDSFEVRITQHAPTLSLILVERSDATAAFVHVQLYFLHAAHGRDRPVFRVDHKNAWFAVFRREFDDLWSEGVEWEAINT